MYEIDKVSYLRIGQQGENQAVTIELDMTSWADEHPDASFAILFKPYNEDQPSPVYTTYDEPILTWVVGSSVTQNVGVGYTEIRAFSAGGLIKKSKVIPTSVESSVSGGSSVTPPAYADWVNNVLGYKVAAETAQEAAEAAQEAAETAQGAAETAQAAAEDAAADAQAFISQDKISLLQLGLDYYPLAALPEVVVHQNKKCSSYDTETFVPAEFAAQDGQDIYVFKVADLIADGITSLSFPDMRTAGGVGQSFILWKAGVFATNTAGTTTDGVRAVSFANYANAEYMLICFLHENAWLRFSKDYSEETIDRGVKGWLRPDDMDADSKAVLTDTPDAITALENGLEQRGYSFPITLTSGIYLSSAFNGVRTKDDTVTIDGVNYAKYWWSGWIDVRGVDTLVLNTITGSGAGYGFRKGNTCTTYPGEPAALKEYIVKVPEDAESFSFSVCLFGQTAETAAKVNSGNSDDIINLRAIPTGEFINRNADAILRSSEGYPPYEMLLSGKTLCIGDSLTFGSKPSGASGTGGQATPYYTRLAAIGSFPDDINVSAMSGYSASDWYNSFSQITDFTAFNNYLIWLGTNYGPTTEPTEEEAAGTETYYYRKIIEDIIAANASARIFLCSVFASKDSVPIVNDCIRQIAALYPANVMGVTNFDDGTLFGETHADLHDGSATNPHFNEGGYFFVASKWLGEIRRLIRENIDKF